MIYITFCYVATNDLTEAKVEAKSTISTAHGKQYGKIKLYIHRSITGNNEYYFSIGNIQPNSAMSLLWK